jgi:CRP-like cAMP-binding protein
LALKMGDVLREHAFLQGLSEEQFAALAGIASEVEFQENAIVLEDGQQSTFFYLLLSGSVAVELRTSRYAVLVQAVGPGQVFGWSALLNQQDTLFQVRAREVTTALRFDGAALKAKCREDSRLGCEVLGRVLQVVAGRVRATELRFAEMCGIRV